MNDAINNKFFLVPATGRILAIDNNLGATIFKCIVNNLILAHKPFRI